MTKHTIDDIVVLAKEIQELSEKNLKEMKHIVNDIITYKIDDVDFIEHVFDNLLDLSYMLNAEKITPIYFQLLDYYSTIDYENAEDYKKFYLEIVMENEIKIVPKSNKRIEIV